MSLTACWRWGIHCWWRMFRVKIWMDVDWWKECLLSSDVISNISVHLNIHLLNLRSAAHAWINNNHKSDLTNPIFLDLSAASWCSQCSVEWDKKHSKLFQSWDIWQKLLTTTGWAQVDTFLWDHQIMQISSVNSANKWKSYFIQHSRPFFTFIMDFHSSYFIQNFLYVFTLQAMIKL